MYSDKKNLLKPLLIIFEVGIIELHHPPDRPFGRLDEGTCG